jgi:hypothetical protein
LASRRGSRRSSTIPARGIERAKPASQRYLILDVEEVKRLWHVWKDELTAADRVL